MIESPWLFVGLGNPGSQYARNRHNVGFMAVEAIADAAGFSSPKTKYKSELREGQIAGQKVLVMQPQTFMNLSGEAVQPVISFYKIPLDRVVVFYDELDLLPGKVRGKRGGGSGGHNGIKSIDAHIGTDYWRVRIGIGHPGNKDLVTGYVLGNFPPEDQAWLKDVIDSLASQAPSLIKNGMDTYMSKVALHSQDKTKETKNGL